MLENKNSIDQTFREAQAATKAFAKESPFWSWWHLATTFTLLAGALVAAALLPWWWARVFASILAALISVRGFIIYHDFMHGTIFKKSIVPKGLMYVYGLLFLSPPSVWRKTHNYHHAHTGIVEESKVGSFPMMTRSQWEKATFSQRLWHRIARNPLIILLSYLTVFVYTISFESFVKKPGKHWDSALALAIHGGLIALLCVLGGFWSAFHVIILPFAIASALGGYMFYAQHNFPSAKLPASEEGTGPRAAVESSSFMKMGPIMRWFTGNIGYHHIHHLNLAVPFYRLPAAMKAIPELQNPGTTSLHPKDIWACFRVKLWDEENGRMISFGDLKRMIREKAKKLTEPAPAEIAAN
ncbi:MAG: fatty acid desaturase [Planctomycetes bacterium]|nr:fatty acid desaturase [Planctomycetota bacterium]